MIKHSSILGRTRWNIRKTLFDIIVNTLASSNMVPRVFRARIYRSMKLDINTHAIFPGCRFTSPRISIGVHTFINDDCYFGSGTGTISIGDNCLIGPQVQILATSHSSDAGDSRGPVIALTTVIEDGVWLGARSLILPGIIVERDCVVAAGAVVTQDCHAAGVYAGVPARRVKDVTN